MTRIPLKIAASLVFPMAFIALAEQASAPESHGVRVANMDSSVKPGDDFYRYTNGGWLKRTEIPPDRAVRNIDAWYAAFNVRAGRVVSGD